MNLSDFRNISILNFQNQPRLPFQFPTEDCLGHDIYTTALVRYIKQTKEVPSSTLPKFITVSQLSTKGKFGLSSLYFNTAHENCITLHKQIT